MCSQAHETTAFSRLMHLLCLVMVAACVALPSAALADNGGSGGSGGDGSGGQDGEDGSPIATTGANKACPDAKIFGPGMINRICWDCIFPMIVAGVPMGGSTSKLPDGAVGIKPFCSCDDDLGVPRPGTQYSMWEPARLVEVVRMPFCSPSMGGEMLKTTTFDIGTPDENKSQRADHMAFYNFHYFSFPLLVMLDLFLEEGCTAGGYSDMDLMYLSELNPLWNDDELSFFTNTEASMFVAPAAMAACVADATAANTVGPTETLFWCAGSWGMIYPMTGNVRHNSSPPRTTSLLATRAIASLHRMGLARQTMGKEAMCESPFQPTIPKSQYKLEQLHPVAEAEGNHWIGETTLKWGEWRNQPHVGEDFVHMIWRWNDCCNETGTIVPD